MTSPHRAIWQQQHVVDVRDAAFATRTYLEQTDVRAFITRVTGTRRLRVACEVGAGYGRMTVVLSEFANCVIGLEREPHFVREAARLLPTISFVQVESLTELPVQTATVDFILTITVLQHLIDPIVQAVAQEISRILRPGGHLLICERPIHYFATVRTMVPMACVLSVGVWQFIRVSSRPSLFSQLNLDVLSQHIHEATSAPICCSVSPSREAAPKSGEWLRIL